MRVVPALVLLAFITTGCATISSVAPRMTAELQQKFIDREHDLATLALWSFTGRIAMQVGTEGWSGTIHWAQQDRNYDLEIRGPIGAGTVRLNRSDQGTLLRLSNGQSFTGQDARELLVKHFGWDIPVDALQRWIIGRPAPLLDKQFELDELGRLLSLRQSGWDVEYKRYGRTGNFDLPEKIFAHNEQAQFRLFVDEWSTR